MRPEGRERCCRCLLLLVVCLCVWASSAASGMSVLLSPLDWSWEAGEASTAQVSISPESWGADGTVRVTLSTDPELEDPGRLVFTSVNGKKMTIRNQKDTAALVPGEDGAFTGIVSWFVPENAHMSTVRIDLDVEDGEGRVLAHETLTMRSEANAAGGEAEKSSIPDISRYIRYVLIVAAVIWALALFRILLNRKHEKAGKES